MGRGGDALKGAASGAAMGTAILPGWGTAIGGAAGGLYGWLSGGGGDETPPPQLETAGYQRDQLRGMLGQNAPQLNVGQSDQSRGQQQQLAAMLFAQANGQSQGAGELAVQRQANNAMANTTSAAQMARGANTAMAMRNAARTNADIGVNAAGQAGIAQLQDQQMATNQLGGLLNAQRGQDIQVAGANMQGQMGQQQFRLNALGQMLSVDQAALGQTNTTAQLALEEKRRRDAQMAALMQAGGTAAAAYAGYSNQNKVPALKPIAPGNPGAGGYYTPGG